MINFVFHHSGQDNILPNLLVKSILKTNPGNNIIQVSDQNTQEIPGVTEFLQFKSEEKILSKQRCELYANLKINEATVYLDTDMLVIKLILKQQLFSSHDILLCKRFWDGMIHSEDTTDTMYAFRNQSLKETWPYIACFVACYGSEFWKNIHNIITTLPREKNDWFADQHAFKILASTNPSIGNVSEKQYACLPDEENNDISAASILHFKGSRKNLMEKYYHYLLC